MLSYVLWEYSFCSFYSSAKQNLKQASICLWEGASISPSCATQLIFSMHLQD